MNKERPLSDLEKTVRISAPLLASHAPGTNMLEQRLSARVLVAVPATLRNGDGDYHTARIRNVSAGGMQLCCDSEAAVTFYPHGGTTDEEGRPVVHATTRLVFNGRADFLTVSAVLQYARRSRKNGRDCILGLQFLELSTKAQSLLNAFFAQRLDDPLPDLIFD